MNRFLLGLKKAGTFAEHVVESPVAIAVAETLIPVAAPEISVVESIIKGEKSTMDFESLGVMLALQALNTYIKNPSKNATVNAQIAAVCTDVLQDQGYTVTAPPTPKQGAAATTS